MSGSETTAESPKLHYVYNNTKIVFDDLSMQKDKK